MSNDLPSNSGDQTKAETAASDACTRSGAFALLLSGVLFLLIPSWEYRQKEIALGRYLTYRLNLELSVDELNLDPAWKNFKDSNGEGESMPLARAPSRVYVSTGAPGAIATAKEQPSVAPGAGIRRGRAPAPPTMVSVKVEMDLPEIPRIVDFTKKLNDSQLLTESRGHSNFYELSISRWVQRRGDLIYRNAFANGCAKKEIELPHGGQVVDRFVPNDRY